MNYLNKIDEVVENLENKPNSLRLKKLVVFTCTKIWITDAVQLSSISLKDLVRNLRELHPTLANLQQALYELANKLNKPTEYLLIAKMISREMEKLYKDDTQGRSSIVNNNETEDFQSLLKNYVKLAVLDLEENQFAQVLKATVEIIDKGNISKSKIVSYLPSTFKAIEFYYAFKLNYRRLFINYKEQSFLGELTNSEPSNQVKKSYQSVELLRRSLVKWFSSQEFREIRNILLQELDPNEEIQLIIHSPNQHLLQLPWHLVFEPFLKNYTKAEIAFRINKNKFYSTKSVFIENIKLLAILGNYGSIDIEAEQQEIAAIPNSEVLLLTEPVRQQLDDQIRRKNWNILFFSSSYGNKFEDIYFNKSESFTIEELKRFLKKAIASGLELAIINCNNGLEIAGKLADLEIPNLIILREHVPPRVAQGFLKLFLKACASGKSVYMAIREAREKLAPIENIFPGATWLPVIFQNPTTEAETVPEFPQLDNEQDLEEEDWSEQTITVSESLEIDNHDNDFEQSSPLLPQTTFYTNISLVKTISGFDSEIYAVAISPDGKKIVGGSGDLEHEDDAVKIWDIDTGNLINSLKGHQHWIYAVAITPDSKKIVSGSFDNTIKIWNINTNTIKPTTIEDYDRVNAIAISPDGKMIVSGSDDNIAKIWSLETGVLIKTLKSHSRRVNSVAITPDGQTIITASDDQTIKVWYLATGSLIDTLISHTKPVLCVVITPDGKNIVSSGDDQTIKIWNIATGALTATLTGHEKSVLAIAISPDGHTIVSSSLDKTIKIWDFNTGHLINTLTGHENIILCLAISPDGRKIVSSSYGEIRVWEVMEVTRIR